MKISPVASFLDTIKPDLVSYTSRMKTAGISTTSELEELANLPSTDIHAFLTQDVGMNAFEARLVLRGLQSFGK